MDELHSRWASPPQAAFCAAVNAAAGSEANDIRASPKKAMIAIVARFSDILFPRFVVGSVTLACIDWKSTRLRTRWHEGRRGLAMTQEPDAEVVIPRGKYIGKHLGDPPADEAEHFV